MELGSGEGVELGSVEVEATECGVGVGLGWSVGDRGREGECVGGDGVKGGELEGCGYELGACEGVGEVGLEEVEGGGVCGEVAAAWCGILGRDGLERREV